MEESNTVQTEAAPASPEGAPRPCSLRAGSRVQLGSRRGTVEELRGSGNRPYEVRIRWDDEVRPVYVVYTTLERDCRIGRLRVL